MSAVFLPILTHFFNHISHKIDHSQEQYENSAFSEFCFSGVMTLLASHYLASVMSFSLCFNQNPCPFVHTVFGNMPNSPSQWLFHVSATGCNFLQLPPQSPLNQTLLNCPHLLELRCHRTPFHPLPFTRLFSLANFWSITIQLWQQRSKQETFVFAKINAAHALTTI